jgi:hypothetical protein
MFWINRLMNSIVIYNIYFRSDSRTIGRNLIISWIKLQPIGIELSILIGLRLKV